MANNRRRSNSYKGAFIASLIINISLVALIVVLFTMPGSPLLTVQEEPSSTDVVEVVADEYSEDEPVDDPEVTENTDGTTTTAESVDATTTTRSKSTSKTQSKSTTTTTAAPTTTTTTAPPPTGDNDGDYTDFF